MSLDIKTARRLTASIEIAVIRREDKVVVERLTLLRYAGHYRADSTEAFAVKNVFGKFSVRSARQLGLSDDSPFEAEVAITDEIDLRAS